MFPGPLLGKEQLPSSTGSPSQGCFAVRLPELVLRESLTNHQSSLGEHGHHVRLEVLYLACFPRV